MRVVLVVVPIFVSRVQPLARRYGVVVRRDTSPQVAGFDSSLTAF